MKPDSIHCAVLLPHIEVWAANLISSPLTWGFPAPSAFTGFAHAIQRDLRLDGLTIEVGGTGIICHQAETQTNDTSFVHTLMLTRNPVDAHGATAAIVEEGRMHMDVSLVLAIGGSDAPQSDQQASALAARIMDLASMRRLAGGSIVPPSDRESPARGWVWAGPDSRDRAFRQIKRRLLPGFALVERTGLLATHLAEMQKAVPNCNALDALFDLIALHHLPPAEGAEGAWSTQRRHSGWLVPVPAGYAAISDLYGAGTVKNARDSTVPFRFVESLLTLGEWRSPHRLSSLNDLFWQYCAEPDEGLYRVRNDFHSVDLAPRED